CQRAAHLKGFQKTSNGILEQSPGGALHSSLFKPKRERKQRTYTLCEVCNIQLNSAAQAQVHYSGKSHQKRLKKITNGKMATSTGRPQVLLGFLSRTNKANHATPLWCADSL
uniref:U1-type domain-containing protein n=1 Tax=Oryzias latipes TaxID=8090 RepID=A0A3P9KGI9_ORYLA